MEKKVRRSVLRGSIVLFLSVNIFNALNFFFHFSMARLLSVTDFGVLSALFSIIYILSVFTESIQIVITRYSAEEKNDGKLKNVLKRALRKSFFISILIFAVYLIAALFISNLTDIDYYLVAFTGFIIFMSLLVPITRGALQGRKKFISLGGNMVFEGAIKLAISIALVFLGWKVFGAMVGTIIGSLLALMFSFSGLKDIIKSKEESASTKEIYSYTPPSFFIILTILAFHSIDVLIARIVFSPETAGFYAVASILSKTIFFGTRPISKAMFPIAAANKFNEKKSEKVFTNSLMALLALVIVALLIFFFFPDLLIRIFSGGYIPESASILFYLGISMSLLSVANLVLLYKLSMGKVRNYVYALIFVLIEVFLLFYFSSNLFEFSIALISSSAIFLWGSIFLFDKENNNR